MSFAPDARNFPIHQSRRAQWFCGEFNETRGDSLFDEEYAAITELIAWKRTERFFTHVVSFIREL